MLLSLVEFLIVEPHQKSKARLAKKRQNPAKHLMKSALYLLVWCWAGLLCLLLTLICPPAASSTSGVRDLRRLHITTSVTLNSNFGIASFRF